ncbi:MAG: hypothetical protein NW220_19340 [Leptolyngbyaceae cyanobacterium bins.349]|nr:hypothetical protein [Leptolyngbyaceae cyanobacterium bins.349]
MSMNHAAIAALLIAATLPLSASGLATSASLTAQAWQPIARINPNQPYQVRLNHQRARQRSTFNRLAEFLFTNTGEPLKQWRIPNAQFISIAMPQLRLIPG